VSTGPRDGNEPLDDELDDEASRELRALYRRLEPQPLADGADEADPETGRVVQWMRGAWRELEVPPARVPIAARRPRRVARFAVLAAAAALVLGVALWRVLRARIAPAPAPLVQTPAPAADQIEVVATLPGQLELRSGTVRLVLLDPPETTTDQPSTETPPGG
jgi:hypothetical protein